MINEQKQQDKKVVKRSLRSYLPDFFLYSWFRVPKFNDFVKGVNIIPFKCPLDEKFDSRMKAETRFRFRDVYDFSLKVNKPITIVIDLLKKPIYNPNTNGFFPSTVKHHSFKLPSKAIPDEGSLNIVMDLIEDTLNNGGAVGVHCKHGLNRTGFIVCAFLVTRLGWDPAIAIECFVAARGHKIKHKVYIKAILSLKPNLSKKKKDGLESNLVQKDLQASQKIPVL